MRDIMKTLGQKLTVEEMCKTMLLNIGADARVQLVVTSKRRAPGVGRLMGREGPAGDFLGEVSPGRWLVDISAKSVLGWLSPSEPP